MELSFVTVVVILVTPRVFSTPIPMEREEVVSCDCDYCEEKVTTIDPAEEKKMTRIVEDDKGSKRRSNADGNDDGDDDGDLDGNGNGDETICARDRDFPDKTFPSVCHMLCHNQCTLYRGALLEKKNTTRPVALAYRTNYYLLWDGPCEKNDHNVNKRKI